MTDSTNTSEATSETPLLKISVKDFRNLYPDKIFGNIVVKRKYEMDISEAMRFPGTRINDPATVLISEDLGYKLYFRSIVGLEIGGIKNAKALAQDLIDAMKFIKANV